MQTEQIEQNILSGIQTSEDVKAIPVERIPVLCREIRDQLISCVEVNGGHLASNLGVVEMTVAIHRVFDSLHDHIIFDVGHQSYVHKLLTGRATSFDTLRAPGGISGFPQRRESIHDAFGTGHASTSLSAGLGFAQADRLSGKQDFTVIVLGDGAFTGGMIHEALNNCSKDLRLILIINENEMSISKNIGQFAQNLARLRSKKGYLKTKSAVERVLERIPFIGRPTRNMMRTLKRAMKDALYGSNYFENMGLRYLGPADGNDEQGVEELLRRAKESGRACVIHLKTIKGKGYDPAMQSPDRYHCLPPSLHQGSTSPMASFSSVFGETLTEIAASDSTVCAVTAAMKQGTGLIPFGQAYPERLFDVGIAEEHAVTFAAGLAAAGYRPVVAIYSTFLQRSYDNILHDVALQELPVLFCIDRAGLNPSDGPTHHGIFDVAFLSHAPGMEIWEPISYASLRHLLRENLRQRQTLCAIRYPAGPENDAVVAHFSPDKSYIVQDGLFCDFEPQKPPQTIILTYGRICARAIAAKEQSGADVGIILMEKLRPWDGVVNYLFDICNHVSAPEKLIFLEEGICSGGLAMNIEAALRKRVEAMKLPVMRTLSINESFVLQDIDESVFKTAGLETENILDAINH